MSRINCRHWKISSVRHFQNGHQNTAQIQHCPISTTFHMWVDYDCQESFRDIIIYPHMKCRWNRTMLNLCGIVAAILKMRTGIHFSMSGINSGHRNLPTYEMHMWVDYDVPKWFLTSKNFYRSPFSKWPPQCRTNSTLFDFKGILKMATGRNFSMSGINSGHHNQPTYQMTLKSDNVEFVRYC
jgi:hypothetical protein